MEQQVLIEPQQETAQRLRDYQRIEQAIHYLDAHKQRQPSLSEVASSVGLSEYHFQRLFARWAGITPKRFLQFLTKEYAKRQLQQTPSILAASLAAGLSGPGRLHDLFVQCEAMTPGEAKSQGQGLDIFYGFHATPFGECLLATTTRGICYMALVQHEDQPQLLQELQARWSQARLIQDQTLTAEFIARIFAPVEQSARPLHLLLKGTNFQIKVWEALLRIPAGAVASYQHIAQSIGTPRAARAVGTAIGQNPIALLIPCHRVIRQLGDAGVYHWGSTRKRVILGWEAAQQAQQETQEE